MNYLKNFHGKVDFLKCNCTINERKHKDGYTILCYNNPIIFLESGNNMQFPHWEYGGMLFTQFDFDYIVNFFPPFLDLFFSPCLSLS